jgi:alpha-beta hydrolase superfamily lysophospholipase
LILWLAAAAGVLVFPVVAVLAISWRSFTPPRILTPVPESVSPWTTESVSFPSGDRTLHGWLVSPPDPGGVVLLVHGWGSDAGEMLAWSPFLAEGGWVTFAFDMRGHGRTRREAVVVLHALSKDVTAALAFLETRSELASLPRAVLGHSMGGAAALLALAGREPRPCPVKAAVISSAFARVETLTDYVLRKRLLPAAVFRGLVLWVWKRRTDEDIRRIEPESTIRAVAQPLLLTHGTRDAVIPDREIERLAAAAPEGTLVQMVAGAGHTDLVDFPAYRRGVLAFLDRHLGGSPPAGVSLEPCS